MLLVKIITFYIECTIFVANIEIVLFILLTGIRTAKYSLPRCFLYMFYYFHNMKNNRLVQQQNIIPIMIDYVDLDYTIPIEPPVLDTESEEELTANEHWHIVKDHLGKWHIGLVFEVVNSENSIVLCADVLVSSSLFFRFPMNSAKQYLIEITEDNDNAVVLSEDMRHNIVGSRLRTEDIYDLPDLPLILKTFWIRIIQRTWRRIYLERIRRLKLRGGIKAQRQFELSGNYGVTMGDGLRGMLHPLMSRRECPDANAMSANIKTD